MSYEKKEIWAVIPARGGSKGITRKNIREVAGKPLIAYSIEQALRSRYLDGVFVSTEDDEIGRVARSYGAAIIHRPLSLAEDDSSSMDVLKHAVLFLDDRLGRRVENVVLLQATTPFRRVGDIDGAIKLFFDQEADSVVSVIQAPHSYNPCWAKEIVDGKLRLVSGKGGVFNRRQDLPVIYWHNGQIYMIRRDHLFAHGDWYEGTCLPYLCPEETFVNIDHPWEMKIAEELIYAERLERTKKISIKIGDRQIGHSERCFIIAEAGVNHNGRMDLARALVDAAAETGVDAVKFQFFDPRNVATAFTPMAPYQRVNMGGEESQQVMLQGLALSEENIRSLKQYTEEKGLIFLCTSHSGIREYEKLDAMGVLAHKVGSGDLLNLPVLRYLAGTGRPLIMGTGMATMEEVKEVHRFLRQNGNQEAVFLHCTTDYPCDFSEVNMNAMISMRRDLECPVGYSDHTLGTEIPVMAASLGACVIEKHFTLDRTLQGPDHRASALPWELKEMVSAIRNLERAKGDSEKRPTASEREISKMARKSLVYGNNLRAGTILQEGDIGVKRPGTGMSPLRYYQVLGRRVKRAVSRDELLSEHDLL